MRKREFHSTFMEEKCEQAQCSQYERERHVYHWLMGQWDSHPPPKFSGWFEPIGTEEASGASIGGHYEARHVVAKKTKDGYEHIEEGVPTVTAWNTQRIRQEYDEWVAIGEPQAHGFRHDYVWRAGTAAQIQLFVAKIRTLLAQIAGKAKIAEASAIELQEERAREGKKRRYLDKSEVEPERKPDDEENQSGAS